MVPTRSNQVVGEFRVFGFNKGVFVLTFDRIVVSSVDVSKQLNPIEKLKDYSWDIPSTSTVSHYITEFVHYLKYVIGIIHNRSSLSIVGRWGELYDIITHRVEYIATGETVVVPTITVDVRVFADSSYQQEILQLVSKLENTNDSN